LACHQPRHPPARDVIDPAIDTVEIDKDALLYEVVEEFDGGTTAVSGSCLAGVRTKGLMLKGVATRWAAVGVLTITDSDVDFQRAEVASMSRFAWILSSTP